MDIPVVKEGVSQIPQQSQAPQSPQVQPSPQPAPVQPQQPVQPPPVLGPALPLPIHHHFASWALAFLLVIPGFGVLLFLMRYLLQGLGYLFYGAADFSFYRWLIDILFGSAFLWAIFGIIGLVLVCIDIFKYRHWTWKVIVSFVLLAVYLFLLLFQLSFLPYQILRDHEIGLHTTLREYFSLEENCNHLKLSSARESCLSGFTAHDQRVCDKLTDPLEIQQCQLLFT